MKPGADDFYVGYLKQAPEALGRVNRRRILIVGFFALVVGGLVAGFQAAYGPGTWDLELRTFRGLAQETPAPSLLVLEPGAGSNAAARVSRTLLVRPLKFGAADLVAGLHGREVELRGTLVERDARRMIEVVPGSVREIAAGPHVAPAAVRHVGQVTLRGEIVDSKCFLGVMNPGHLKTHRACAVNCIRGGIPPVLLVRDQEDRAVYVLLTDVDGGPVNDRVLEMVAEPVEITGALEHHDDLLVLRADPATYRRLPRPR